MAVPALDACVLLPAGDYRLREGDDGRTVRLGPVLIGRWPVVGAHVRRFAAATGHGIAAPHAARLADDGLADHPATGLTYADALAFCAWAARELGRPVRLPTGAEWEAVARGTDGRAWPWGDAFDAERCACAESLWGRTAPVTAHPQGASPLGAEQLAGNVWEWVSDVADGDWRTVRGGCYLDHAWGVRAARALPADPCRATATTGFRIAIDLDEEGAP
ncbi:MAG TPA: SUMF1/EgtB/PvdO family nonheme iron enzyme [Solirubrobacteraceae bacterium]